MNRRRFMKAIGLANVCGSLSVCLSQISKKPARQPNILWINSEDNSISWVGCYGSPNAKTPHIDQLAWEQHYVEGKCDATTGRFFRPRVSEEFYDNDTDFHNVNNLIDSPAHQEIINELRQALRQQQLEIFDSGLLPEAMRMRRAAANNLTVYEMVRNPDLYPLEKYLNYSDQVLARDPKHLPIFVEGLKDKDEGIRYWAVCGLFLLEDRAMPAKEQIEATLEDEADEVKLMAAWALDRLGEPGVARTLIKQLNEERADLEKPDLQDMYYSRSLNNWINGTSPYIKRD